MKNNHRIILPGEAMQETLIQQQMQKPRVDMHGQPIPIPPKGPQIPFLQIPVIDEACYLLYAICKHALDSKDFEQLSIVTARIKEMHKGLLFLYQQYGVKETEYRKFCVTPQERDSETVSIEEEETETNSAGVVARDEAITNFPEEGLRPSIVDQEGGTGNEFIRQSEEDT